jgi:lysophospholipase L1-like esterase
MMDIYDLCGSITLRNVPKYDFARKPDAVVIRLGSNDYLNGGLAETPEVYTAGVKQFIGLLREKYGAEVPIVWTYGHTDDGHDFWDATKATLDGLKAEGDDQLHYCKVSVAYCPKSEGGDGLHPDVKRSKVTGQEVADFLAELLK